MGRRAAASHRHVARRLILLNMEKTLNIYQRVTKVREAVAYIRKEKKVESYMAVTHDAVTALTRDQFIAHGIVIVPTCIVQSAVKDTGTLTSRGTPFIRFEARYRFEVVNMDDPADKFSIEIEAHALDHGDKAPGKALSYAKKYAVLKLLEIESGEGEEDREEQHKPKPEAHKSVAREVWDTMTQKQKSTLTDIGVMITDLLKEGEDQRAFEYYTEQKEKLDTDEQVALWSRLDSEQRSTIKRLGEAHKKSDEARRAKGPKAVA